MAFRSRCTSGSPISSSSERSSSISCPSTTKSTCLPSARAASRTTRGKRSNTCHTGTMRLVMMPSCMSAMSRDACVTVSVSAASLIVVASCCNRPRVMTSSPMRFISVSRRCRSMRMWRCWRAGASSLARPPDRAALPFPLGAGAAVPFSGRVMRTVATYPAERTTRSISSSDALCHQVDRDGSIEAPRASSVSSGGCNVHHRYRAFSPARR